MEAVLPYGGSSGWAGSDTSRARAEHADRIGVTSARQKATLKLLIDAGVDGLTWRDLSALTGEHHGATSGALSNLHKAGVIVRLTDTRNRCAIYVTPDCVQGRETSAYKPNATKQDVNKVLDEIIERIIDEVSYRGGFGFIPQELDVNTIVEIVKAHRV